MFHLIIFRKNGIKEELLVAHLDRVMQTCIPIMYILSFGAATLSLYLSVNFTALVLLGILSFPFVGWALFYIQADKAATPPEEEKGEEDTTTTCVSSPLRPDVAETDSDNFDDVFPAVFQRYDLDGSGRINNEELRRKSFDR